MARRAFGTKTESLEGEKSYRRLSLSLLGYRGLNIGRGFYFPLSIDPLFPGEGDIRFC